MLSSLLAMSLMWAMRVFVKYFYVTTFRQSKAERAFIFGVKQGGISLAKSIQNQDPAQYVLAGFVSEAGNMQNRILMGVRVSLSMRADRCDAPGAGDDPFRLPP